MIQSRIVKELLTTLLKPVSVESVGFKTNPLQSAVLLASTNGSVISFSDTNDKHGDSHSINNLKMMSLLIRDKWSEDENQMDDRANLADTCYKYEVQSQEKKDLFTNIYTYEIEDLHACVAQIPQSDLLLLFTADASYPYGMLVLKMKKAILAFEDMYGYKLG